MTIGPLSTRGLDDEAIRAAERETIARMADQVGAQCPDYWGNPQPFSRVIRGLITEPFSGQKEQP